MSRMEVNQVCSLLLQYSTCSTISISIVTIEIVVHILYIHYNIIVLCYLQYRHTVYIDYLVIFYLQY